MSNPQGIFLGGSPDNKAFLKEINMLLQEILLPQLASKGEISGTGEAFERDFFCQFESMRLLCYKCSPFKEVGRYKDAKNDISCRRR